MRSAGCGKLTEVLAKVFGFSYQCQFVAVEGAWVFLTLSP